MKKLIFYFILLFLSWSNPLFSQSSLLESVKKNPNKAIEMCEKFKEFNARGISANSEEAVDFVSKRNKLTAVNAEILSIYVIGIHCPNVI